MSPRTYLFVPGNRPERFAKALGAGADRVVLDLEDAVASSGKALARQHVADWLPTLPDADAARVVVRRNHPPTDWHLHALASLPGAKMAGSCPLLIRSMAGSDQWLTAAPLFGSDRTSVASPKRTSTSRRWSCGVSRHRPPHSSR